MFFTDIYRPCTTLLISSCNFCYNDILKQKKEHFVSYPVIFLDDGGVMNDNTLRGFQWERMVAEFFKPVLGGTFEAWSDFCASVQIIGSEPTAATESKPTRSLEAS